MRVYLDNCCYNRPFDNQGQLRVRLETEAKLRVQDMMRSGELEYVWSDMLSMEVSDNPVPWHREKIMDWIRDAYVNVEITDEVVSDVEELMQMGLKNADALHLACASAADCDVFFTVDRGILSKVREFRVTRVMNPVEFILEAEHDDD